MFPRRVLEDHKDDELGAGLVDYVCYRNQRLSLQELRAFLGDAVFLNLMNLFAGTYIKLPTGKRLKDLYYDYHAGLTVRRIRNCRKKGDLREWSRQEGILQSIAKKSKRRYSSVYKRGIEVLSELKKAESWMRGLKNWEKKFLEEE